MRKTLLCSKILFLYLDFFNRKIRSMENFAFVKGTEVRNLLFFGLLSHLYKWLSIDQYAHMALYVCAIRLLHSGNLFGSETSIIAGELLDQFHRDHHLFYHELKSFKLHLHSHYSSMYRNYGSLINLGCFGQESFIGFVSDNYHQVRYYGDAIVHYYSIDFALQQKKQKTTIINGPKDRCNVSPEEFDIVNKYHSSICRCNQINSCCEFYRRFTVHEKTFHSLIYIRRMDSISYFVRYSSQTITKPDRFGSIALFFTCNGQGYAVIRNHRLQHRFSDQFKQSSYYHVLKEPIDRLYYVLDKDYRQNDLVPVELILNHCIIVEQNDSIFVTNVLSYNEHD